jgi:hypothetical protein
MRTVRMRRSGDCRQKSSGSDDASLVSLGVKEMRQRTLQRESAGRHYLMLRLSVRAVCARVQTGVCEAEAAEAFVRGEGA